MKLSQKIACCLALIPFFAMAEQPTELKNLQNEQNIHTEIQAKEQNGITYICGGIGQNETDYMKQVAKDYNLSLTFANRKGNYLADVDVDIQDKNGNPILQTKCDGPIMHVNIPDNGKYQIKAETLGEVINRTVSIRNNRHANAVLVWADESKKTSIPTQ